MEIRNTRKWKSAGEIYKSSLVSALWGGHSLNSSKTHEKVLGLRWEGKGDDPGFPHVGRHPTWMPLPDFMTRPILERMREEVLEIPGNGELEEIEKAIDECLAWEAADKKIVNVCDSTAEMVPVRYTGSSWIDTDIVFDNGWFSAVWGRSSSSYSTLYGQSALGIRWKGGLDDKGYPCSFGHRVYFVVPDLFVIPALETLKAEATRHDGIGSVSILERVITECNKVI